MLRIPVPQAERFVDPAVMRRQMLDETFTRIGDTLDIEQVASELLGALVPHFCNAADLLLLESLAGDDELPADGPEGSVPLRRIALRHERQDPAWEAAFPTGEILRYPANTPYYNCMDTAKPVLETTVSKSQAGEIARAWQRKPVAKLLSGASMLMLPLVARGTILGFFACTRQAGFRRFDAYDTEIGMDFASRAAMFIDNARRYSREHATALTLQRSMLPTGLSSPSSVEVRHRYLPGSKLIEVGGDWYESIALPGGRVALVVGDVAGHGVRAAVTMGRLRTAIHTLAMLELPPAESLQQLDELMHTLGEREPHFATCAYAVYDAVSGDCEVAVAGHLPPLLVHPDGSNELLDVPPAPPLGIGDGEVESRQFKIEDGSLFVLYTDGLVENKGQDISDGLARLRGIFGPGSPTRPLEDLCKATLDGVYSDHQRDDIALLIARLRRLPEDHHASWTFEPKLTAVREARVGAGRADEALGPGRHAPDHRAARLRAGHQRGQVLPRRRDAAAGQREGAGLRGAGQLRGAAQAPPGQQRGREWPGPAGRPAALQALGRAPHPGRQGGLVRAAAAGRPRPDGGLAAAALGVLGGYRACAFAVIMWVLLRPVSLA